MLSYVCRVVRNTGTHHRLGPHGVSPRNGQVPVKVNRILCTWIVLVQVLLWSGLALRVHQDGWRPYWATEVLGGIQLYMLTPLITPSKGVWRARFKAGAITA